MTSYRLPKGGLIDRATPLAFTFDGKRDARALPATRSPRRCWPTAASWSAAASNIIARAAS